MSPAVPPGVGPIFGFWWYGCDVRGDSGGVIIIYACLKGLLLL